MTFCGFQCTVDETVGGVLAAARNAHSFGRKFRFTSEEIHKEILIGMSILGTGGPPINPKKFFLFLIFTKSALDN
jgi:hypothetical protein